MTIWKHVAGIVTDPKKKKKKLVGAKKKKTKKKSDCYVPDSK